MTRSGHYWLSILPEDIREKFLNNYGNFAWEFKKIDDYLNLNLPFRFFIERSFVWRKSPEGQGYWLGISNIDPMEFIKIKRDKKINDILE